MTNDYGRCFGGYWKDYDPGVFASSRHYRSCDITSDGVCGNYIGVTCGWFPGLYRYPIDGAAGTCTALGSQH